MDFVHLNILHSTYFVLASRTIARLLVILHTFEEAQQNIRLIHYRTFSNICQVSRVYSSPSHRRVRIVCSLKRGKMLTGYHRSTSEVAVFSTKVRILQSRQRTLLFCSVKCKFELYTKKKHLTVLCYLLQGGKYEFQKNQ